jgi:pyruvate,water dikinase
MIRIIGGTDKLDVKNVGGKSAHLNYLKSKGLPVPGGLIIENGYFTSDAKIEFLSLLDPKKLYAVRSSALDEDGSNYSFAGLQDSYLNIEYNDILTKVEACYQSQFNERASEYRKTFGIGDSRGMTVVIQEMVDADFAGVMFTQNPLNNRIDQIVVEVVQGLGEDLVSGYHTPSTYTIDKKNPSDFELKDHDANLDSKLINELVKYAYIIEKIYDSPQDIEFAIKDGEVFILQARPITTITHVPKQQREGLRFYMSFAHLQNMTYPILPIGAEMIQKMVSTEKDGFLKGRILYNGEFIFFDISEILLAPNFIYKKVIGALENINFNLPELASSYRDMHKSRKMLPLQLLKVLIIMISRIIRLLKRKNVSNDSLLKSMEEHVLRFTNYSDEELVINQNKVAMPLFEMVLPYLIAGMLSFFKLKKLFEKWNLDMKDFNKLISGLDGNVAAEMGLLYDDMLLHYGTNKGDKIFNQYIEKFGMRVDGEIDLGRNRPKDNLKEFKLTVKKRALEHNGESLREKHNNQLIEAGKIECELKEQLSKKQFKQLNHWLKRLRTYYVLREHPKYMLVRIFDRYRKMIDTPFETIAEKLSGGCDLKIIEERKVRYEEANSKSVPIAILSNGLILKPTQKQSDGSIQGFGVSSGKVTATVRVIEKINDDILQAGEILVTKFTDPGWTPMFAKASGIITEVGGLMTHGAIVSREYGIPAVVGIEDVVNVFKTGDVITIDGDNGTIVIKKE